MSKRGSNYHLRDRWWHGPIRNNWILVTIGLVLGIVIVLGVGLFARLLEGFVRLL